VGTAPPVFPVIVMPTLTEPALVAPGTASSAPVRARNDTPRVALVGNPNTGKTTLFNRLCGARAKTSNFPGTTTTARIGRCSLGKEERAGVEIVDLPGIYRVALRTPESEVCRSVLRGEGLYRRPDAVVVVVDACNLTRNLMLVGELLAFGEPVLVALNMVDLAQRRGLTLDSDRLAELLGCPVVPMVARTGHNLTQLRRALGTLLADPHAGARRRPPPLDEQLEDWADRIVEASVSGVGSGTDTLTERLDETFTHPVLGVVLFAVVMGGLFWTLFALATIPMDLIEATFALLGGWVAATVPAGAVRDLIADGIIGGIAGSLVFLPQICLLFFLISLLEDTGYLARAAFVMDRLLCRFGLPGHAFVPLLSSHACALPGIMATRLIPDHRDRLATILVAPLMSCSARLPVYVLVTSMLFVDRPLLAGVAFAGCYLLGATAALVSAYVIRRTIVRGVARPMVLELPTYKVPSLGNALVAARDQGLVFLKTAGTIIMAISIVMWWLSAYPTSPPTAAADALRVEASATAAPDAASALREQADRLDARNAQANSFAGRLGRAVQPVFAPLGYDWQLTVGVLTSFLAREVFVSTMSVLLGGSDDPDLADRGVLERIRRATRDDGSPLFTRATSASVLVFFVLAMQCLSTLTVTRQETGLKWAGVQLVYMTAMAYGAALITYQGLRLAGIS
jgi:ferrous iron transport protein B